MKRRDFVTSIAASGLGLSAAGSRAQQFPVKRITFICAHGAGGMVDIISRNVAQSLSSQLGQTVIVENRPGANQIIAATAVAKSPPDGYTLMLCDEGVVTLNPHLFTKLPYAVEDFTPVADLVDAQSVLVASRPCGATTLQEFVDMARARAGNVSYGSLGLGGVPHLMMERVRQVKKFDAVHVPYKSYPEAVQAILGDQVQGIFGSIGGPPLQHFRSGALIPIAVTGSQRSPLLPSVPTFEELGVSRMPRGQFVVLGPAGMPASVVQTLNAAMRDAVRGEMKSTLLLPNGLEALGNTPAEFAASLQNQSRIYSQLVREVGVRLD